MRSTVSAARTSSPAHHPPSPSRRTGSCGATSRSARPRCSASCSWRRASSRRPAASRGLASPRRRDALPPPAWSSRPGAEAPSLLPFPQTAVSAVRRSFPAARLDCGVTLEGGSLTLTKKAPPFRREERRARSEHRLDRRRVCEIGRDGMPLTEAGDRIDRRLGSFAIRPVMDHDTRAGLGKPDGDRPPARCRATPLPPVRSALAGRWAPPERSGDFVWTGELVSWMPVDVLKADEGATFELAGILERPLMELHMGVVVEQDVHRLVRRALELLSREHGAMTPREDVEVGADDETDVLEAHPIDALMKRRDQLDELDRSRLGERQRVCEEELGDRPSVPDVFEVGDSSNSSRRTRYSRHVRVLTARWLTGSATASIPSSEHRSTCRR